MTDHQAELFLIVVESGSFNQAEARAFISKQAIIKQINQLEESIGVALLKRTNHGITPTAAGQELYAGITALSSMKQNLLDRIQRMSDLPVIRLANVEHHILIPSAEAAFCRAHPEIHLQRSTFSNVKELELLEAGHIDLAETREPVKPLHAPFVFYPLISRSYVCLMSKKHPLAEKAALVPDDLSGYRTVIDENPGQCPFYASLSAVCGDQCTLIPESESGIRKINLLHDAYADGAVCITPSPVVQTWKEPAIVPFAVPYKKRYGIVCSADAPEYLQRLVQYLTDYYRELPSQSAASSL